MIGSCMNQSILESSAMATASAQPDAKCYALVACAGVGERAGAGGPKQYRQLAGQTVVAHTLRALARVPRIAQTLVVLSPDDRDFGKAKHTSGTGPYVSWTIAAIIPTALLRGPGRFIW